jgi:pimeloyl-ACP methyl ester carboxylesterase
VLAVAAAGCSGDGDDGDDASGATGERAEAGVVVDEDPTFVPGECWWEVPADVAAGVTVTCGTVEVPADRTDADTDTITLAVARLHGPTGDAAADVPTLVFGGTLDPVTPYDGSRAQAEAMPDARLVTVPRGGHGAVSFDDCTVSALTTFWSDPAADLPTCVEAIEPLPFSVPAG